MTVFKTKTGFLPDWPEALPNRKFGRD